MDNMQFVKQIQVERIVERINILGGIGEDGQGGVTRLAFSKEDLRAKEVVESWMREAGLCVHVSPIGNILGRLTLGSDEGEAILPSVMTGSHADTVVSAGRFDGTLGVIAAIEIAHVLHNSGVRLRRPLDVVCFAMEESSRFKAGYAFGSKVFTNQVIGDGMLLSKDKFGKCLAQVICDQITFDEHDCIQITDEKAAMAAARKCINASRYPTDTIRAFVELHIEQGPRLHSTSTPIGIVMAIAAPVRFDVLFSGQQNHSGTTPMDMRKDALAAASEAILVIEEICKASADRVVGTVGVIQVKPNVINVIPGAAKITIDLRSDSLAERNRVLASVLSALETISAKRKIRHEVRSLSEDSPVSMSGHIVSLIEANCARLDIPCARMNSWAGHDSAQIGKYVSETGMIFVPSRDGISHDPREWTDTADILQGAQVLMLTLLDLLQLQT